MGPGSPNMSHDVPKIEQDSPTMGQDDRTIGPGGLEMGQDVSNVGQDSLKMCQDGPQSSSKIAARWAKMALRCSPYGPRWTKTAPHRPYMPINRQVLQNLKLTTTIEQSMLFMCTKAGQTCPQDAPRYPQDGPRSFFQWVEAALRRAKMAKGGPR
jgi:hypothetical protein